MISKKHIQIVKTMILAAKKASVAILEIYRHPFKVTYKTDHSPLTQADLQATKIITKTLQPLKIPLISEEMKNEPYIKRKQWKECFIFDPLDGTKEFVAKNGEFSINIAYVYNGTPVLGVLYIPTKNKYYYSDGKYSYIVHKGITKKLSTKCKVKSPLRIVASRSYSTPETTQYINSLNKKHTVIKVGSAYKLGLLAEGKADMYPRLAITNEWDIAAGHAIAKTAGRNVINFKTKKELKYNKKNLKSPWFIAQ